MIDRNRHPLVMKLYEFEDEIIPKIIFPVYNIKKNFLGVISDKDIIG